MIAIVKAFLKRWGTANWKQRVWDKEYRDGAWARQAACGQGPRDSALEIIESYARGGDILELGCGGGETALDIADIYNRYVGVDISRTAVRQGELTRSRHPSRADKITLLLGDIAEFVPAESFNVILFRESIYYLPHHRIVPTLHRLAPFLAGDGVFIVRLHDRLKHRRISEMIEQHFRVVERSMPETAATLTLVFRPADSGAGEGLQHKYPMGSG